MATTYYSTIKIYGGVRKKITLYPCTSTALTTETPFPEGALIAVSEGAVKFDKAPVKIAATDERTLKFDLRRLDEADTALRDIIFTPTLPSVFYPWPVKFCNVWIISDDGGNGSLPEADFIVRFIGAQKDAPDASGTTNAAISTFDIELVSLYRHIIEGLNPFDIARQLNGDATALGGTITSETRTELWDTVYLDAHSEYVVVWDAGYQTTGDQGYLVYETKPVVAVRRFTMFKLSELFREIAATIEYVWRELFRDSGLTVAFDGTYLPLSNLTFYKQSHDIDDSTGSALDYDDLYYIGIIETQKEQPGSIVVTPWAVTGGAICTTDNNKGWLAAYTNCWDLLGDLASTFGAKVIPAFDGLSGVLYWMAYRASRAAAVSIDESDFYDKDITWKKGEYRIRGCAGQIVGATGVNKVAANVPGASENRDSGTIKALFNNLPFSGKEWGYTEFYLLVGSGSGTESFNIRCGENALYYKEASPGWLVSGDALIRTHHHVDIADGAINYTAPSAGTLGTYDDALEGSTALFRLWETLFIYGVTRAQQSGLPYRLCYVNKEMLSGETMLYEGTGFNTTFSLEKIGDSYTLDPAIITAGFTGIVGETCWLIEVKEKTELLNSFTLLAIGT